MPVIYVLVSFAVGGFAVWYWTIGPGHGWKRKNIRRTGWDRFMGQQRYEMVPKKGWWRASDGRFYPPEQHSAYRRHSPPPPKRLPWSASDVVH